MRLIDVLWVGLGGGLGSLLRWQLGKFIEKLNPTQFRYGTFVINVTGAFVIAYLSTAYAIEWHQRYGDMMAAFILTGVLGGYTTFSSMQLDAVQMSQKGRHGLAVTYLVTSVGFGLLAAAAGVSLAL
ncbi:fluoride efflux transporter FluC [Orrella sp. 11846]|uniref:fluoride efflux transporter FluC n=1 Tax=Orrella sp. 11846 TaxID=3409913 RepID=UPI003B5BD9FF